MVQPSSFLQSSCPQIQEAECLSTPFCIFSRTCLGVAQNYTGGGFSPCFHLPRFHLPVLSHGGSRSWSHPVFCCRRDLFAEEVGFRSARERRPGFCRLPCSNPPVRVSTGPHLEGFSGKQVFPKKPFAVEFSFSCLTARERGSAGVRPEVCHVCSMPCKRNWPGNGRTGGLPAELPARPGPSSSVPRLVYRIPQGRVCSIPRKRSGKPVRAARAPRARACRCAQHHMKRRARAARVRREQAAVPSEPPYSLKILQANKKEQARMSVSLGKQFADSHHKYLFASWFLGSPARPLFFLLRLLFLHLPASGIRMSS